ncbi:MAG: AAA family ATPase [Tannerella sp.]|jgi:exonuclease SbcC|nr:AAA family ATPase [Tannerella sp.]
MKILSIRGKNLASLEGEFALDFTTEPLLSAGIFAITGNTGSGKSTLLDALCLALFDDTPRMSRAVENNVSILDVRDKTINQKDSRTILRRGTSDGYAEVDFQSLGGEKFRSTWSVKRARGKVDGSLQSSEIRLLNLSSGNEAPGRKTELLSRITELIGLTFDQFTRAVLLAQGDFATFLKAKQSEKAELLEKLTGTDVYSRISVLIYEKTKQAEQEYLMLKERIRDIELLSEEQIAAYLSEKTKVEAELALLKAEVNVFAVKIKWLDDKEAICKGIIQAEKHLAGIRNTLAEAKPRYDFIAQIENVQEIRDTFMKLQGVKKQLEESLTHLQKKALERDANARTLQQAVQVHAALEKEQEALDREIAAIEPVAIQARALDVRITGARTNVEEAAKEYGAAQTAKERIDTQIRKITGELETARAETVRLASWFEAHHVYRSVIPQKDLIISLLDESQTAGQQSLRNRNLQKENETLLETEVGLQAKYTAESERLNQLLPAEIAVWRDKLKDGEPCPVCGSLHHPAQRVTGEQSLHEKELNKAKQQAADGIAKLTHAINDRKAEITRLATLAENYAAQSAGAMQKVAGYLLEWPAWKEDFEKNSLQAKLRQMAALWTKNTEETHRLEGIINTRNSLLQSEQSNATEARNQVAAKEKKKAEAVAVLADLQKERATLLGGKSVDKLAVAYANRKKALAGKMKQAVEDEKTFTAQQELLKGIITQITAETSRLKTDGGGLQQEIDRWIAGKQGGITEQQLAGILSKDPQWVHAEKQFLNGLKEQETSAGATLHERNSNLSQHLRIALKPSDETETKAVLLEQQLAKNHHLEQNTTRMIEIDLALLNHRKGKERIRAYEKELDDKGTRSDNWKKLNDLLGSATGSKFKEIAQGYTLDALLTYANKHLQELASRYELQRIPNTLALQVADLDMLGEIRTVHSLSGGESFLLSLALALGLSSLSSNRMKIESLFIDEGFGALDVDTLRTAMDALERLQTQGRKIGVISHVAEMTERIATQIRVLKTANGRSVVKIVGA